MKTVLLFTAALCLGTTAFNISNPANAVSTNSTSPYVISKSQFPNTRWAIARHTIRVAIPQNSRPIQQLSIDVPEKFEFPLDRIEISDGARKINAPVSRQARRLQINFDRPIAPNTTLRIDINGVDRQIGSESPTYYLYDTSVNGISNFIGEAYFPRPN
jgi:Protein of unknown function (DUF2808)